jgi:hypothetical protein
MSVLGQKNLEKKTNIEDLFGVENSADPCSKQNISISNTTEFIKPTDMGHIDDTYDPGF